MRKKWIIVSLLCAVLAIGLEAFLLMTAVHQDALVTAYVLAKPCEANTVIKRDMLSEIELSPEVAKQLKALPLGKLMGAKPAQNLVVGKLLAQSDFEVSQSEQPMQTMIVKLNPEQSHCGQVVIGEIIDLICYRQGSVVRIENLKVEAVTPVAPASSSECMLYLTLAGPADALESLLLSQQEGVVTILKKTAVQIP